MIHIEGMGVLGCLIAIRLDQNGVKFTWFDNDAEHTAWRACTGAIYPGDETDNEGLRHWRDTLGNLWWYRFVEPAVWTFNHKHPPHKFKGQMRRYGGKGDDALGVTSRYSLHFNAQKFVLHVRKMFYSSRAKQPPSDSRCTIIAHGSGFASHYYWGWTRLVKLEYAKPLFTEQAYRSAFYFREGRFVMCYAYPVPKTKWWYAGSSIIKQRIPKPLVIQPKYDVWKRKFEKMGAGIVRVVEEGDFIEGWRPAGNSDSLAIISNHNRHYVPSMWHNGVRHSPMVVDNMMKRLREYGEL